jgi:hypothetical protein
MHEYQGKENARNTNIMAMRAELEALQAGIGNNR